MKPDYEIFTLEEIEKRLSGGEFPFIGRTELGSARFAFLRPSYYCATAVHAGSRIRNELISKLKIGTADRRREEDPGTDWFLRDFPIQIIASDSRYEYDINREPGQAIYDVAWGMEVWKGSLSKAEREVSLAKHDEFHQLMDIVARYLIRQNRYGIIFDLHSFNYRRDSRQEDAKPDINIGFKPVNCERFGRFIDDFIRRLAEVSIDGHRLRVTENEIFSGGYLSRRLSSKYYDRLLVLAIEFKKLYIDEWSGKISEPVLEELVGAFFRVVQETITRQIQGET